MGHKGEERGRPGQAARPLPPSPNRTRKGGAPPFPLLPPPFLLQQGKRGGSPTPGGSRTPPGAPHGGRPHPPLPPLYTGAGGHPRTNKLIFVIVPQPCAVPPSTIFHLGHIVAVLRRSPVSVEHHHHHHAVVLTKLIPEALLGRSPGSVIELNVC